MTSINTDIFRVLQRENVRLHDENHELKEELFRLRSAIQALIDLEKTLQEINLDTDAILLIGHILMAALDAVDSDNGSLMLMDEKTEELVFVDVRGEKRYDLLGYHLPPGKGIVGWSISQKESILVPDVSQDIRFSPMVDEAIGFRTTSLICVPLFDNDRPLGAIEVVNSRSGQPFQEGDLNIMILVGMLASQAIQQAERLGSDSSIKQSSE